MGNYQFVNSKFYTFFHIGIYSKSGYILQSMSGHSLVYSICFLVVHKVMVYFTVYGVFNLMKYGKFGDFFCLSSSLFYTLFSLTFLFFKFSSSPHPKRWHRDRLTCIYIYTNYMYTYIHPHIHLWIHQHPQRTGEPLFSTCQSPKNQIGVLFLTTNPRWC